MSDLELTMMRRVGELNKENARLKTEIQHLMVFCNCTLIPNKELQAQVERLRKAGDGLIIAYQWLTVEQPDIVRSIEAAFKEWNAAKEGKQP